MQSFQKNLTTQYKFLNAQLKYSEVHNFVELYDKIIPLAA